MYLGGVLRSRLIVSSKVFQVVFVHFVCNSAPFLASCCYSFLLHFEANSICNILSFTSTGSTSISSKISSLLLWSNRVYLDILRKNLISTDAYLFITFLRVQSSLRRKKTGTASASRTFILDIFWTQDCLKVLFTIPSF